MTRRRWTGLLRRRRPRIIAMTSFRDEMRFLPGMFQNLEPLVDGIVCLDDHSSDGSGGYAAEQPKVLEVFPFPGEMRPSWDDSVNHRLLVEAGWRHDADWLIGVDADERLERGFRERAENEIRRARREGHSAYWVHVREMWDTPTTYRMDGLWAAKHSARFFQAREDHVFDERELHSVWAPLNDMSEGGMFPWADIVLYHLRMMRPDDRRARQAKYERIDPDNRWQSFGYSYMTDPEGLVLEHLPPGREYEPLAEL